MKEDELEFGMYPLETAALECVAATDENGHVHILIKGFDEIKTYGQLIELNVAVLGANQIILKKLADFNERNNIDPSWTLQQLNLLAANTPYDDET